MAAVSAKYTLETKRQAVEYFNSNNVPKHVEELLNKMFKEKPEDIFGYMSEHFGAIAKSPTITNVSAKEVLSSRGHPSVKLELNCFVNGVKKPVKSIVLPIDGSPPITKVKTPDLKGKSPEPPKQKTPCDPPAPTSVVSGTNLALDIDYLIERVQDTITPRVSGVEPMNQQGVDQILKGLLDEEMPLSRPASVQAEQSESDPTTEKIDELSGKKSSQSRKSVSLSKKQSVVADKKLAKESNIQIVPDMEEEKVTRDYAVLGVSMATVIAGSMLKKMEVFEHLANTFLEEPSGSQCMPLPVMTLLSSGKLASGKQNMIKEVLILPKPGESTSKGLQMLTEVYHQMGALLQQKLGASGRCVTDDGSYSPPLDKPETALEYLQDAVSGCGYTLGTDLHIILNIAANDFYDQDREAWTKLNQRIGEKCFVIGNELYRRNPSILATGVTEKLSSVALLSADNANTVTELWEKIRAVADQGGLVMLSKGQVEDVNTLAVDFAVATGARFIRLGGPARMEHVTKHRRMIEIEQILEQNGKLIPQEPHVFPVVNVPEEEPGDRNEAEEIR
ncbi:enolase 4 isoform X2 [Nematostella vectensis]|uniref:enolase 4 isoform X2 n=1 Tax=Nematostella vectensis TaxID=45351 RepID=UPI0020779AFD|nr:enolase 4 isoform X2 [Nematostella vectensis]